VNLAKVQQTGGTIGQRQSTLGREAFTFYMYHIGRQKEILYGSDTLKSEKPNAPGQTIAAGIGLHAMVTLLVFWFSAALFMVPLWQDKAALFNVKACW
jgi:hypothetical protein